MLRVIASIFTGAVRAYDVTRVLPRDGNATPLGEAFQMYGRIFKSLHILAFVDDENYRRDIKGIGNLQEGRHSLAGLPLVVFTAPAAGRKLVADRFPRHRAAGPDLRPWGNRADSRRPAPASRWRYKEDAGEWGAAGLAAACGSAVVKNRCTVSSGWVLWFARLKISAPSRAARSTEASSSAVDS
jgi:hypothetical protein